MDRIGSRSETKLHNNNTRPSFSIYRNIFWARPQKSHNHKSRNHHPKRHDHYKRIQQLIAACLIGSASPTFASDVGGVSATANPVANSSGSVTNQAIQVLQGPYITNTYGGGIQCQGPTMNLTPFATGNIVVKRPYEDYWMDPVYNNVDANDDSVPDNPGEILYYKPVRTGQKDSSTLSIGVSATWSKPLDKKLQALCKTAATTQIEMQKQLTANKRLDFEIARLKNCGELMKAGIMFHKQSPYYAVCADVVLVNPPGTLPDHSHSIPSSVSSKVVTPSTSDNDQSKSLDEKVDVESSQKSSELSQSPSSQSVLPPSIKDPQWVLQIGRMQSQQ